MVPSARYGNIFQAWTETPSDERARFQEHVRKRLPDLHVVDMMDPISFFVEVDLFLRNIFILYNNRQTF